MIVGQRSDMRTLSRQFDWSVTAVGPAENWPQSLRTAMNMVLDCGFPMILWWGPELVQFYNDAYVEILQGKHPRALGQRGRECWTEVWDAIAPLLAEVAQRGVPVFKEDLLLPLNRSGYLEECYFTFSYSPIRDERGGVGGILCTVVETTAKVLSARRLRELDEAKTAFFNNVSHEFRTPLTLMLGPLEELEAGGEVVSEQGRAQLDGVRRNALRLLKLVNTLLEFSRIEAGRIEGSFRPTDLGVLSADLASTFRSAVEAAGLRLAVEVRPLPERVYVDRAMWERIVLNLLSNALKFTFSGEIRVGVGPSADGRAAELRVADTGTGIPPEELPHLFERFRRVRGAKARTHEGTGIGLALVHDLAELHGGSVAVESALERGSTFTVRVPLGRAHLPPEQVEEDDGAPAGSGIVAQYLQEARDWSRASGPAGERVRTGRPLVLVADDNADLRAYIARLFADRYDVETVGDGAAALQALARELPDLLVTDAMMPLMDGFELLRRLRADERTARLPVIMLSARAGQESAVEGLEAGADDYLVKPFSADELRARAEAHLKVARLRDPAAGGAREQRFLMEATRVLGSSLDLAATVAQVLDIALPALGDVCTIRLVDERGTLTGADAAHVDPRKRELTRELYRAEQNAGPVPGGVLDTVLRSGVSALHPVVSPLLVEAEARGPRHLSLHRAIGLRSVMIVPLAARGRMLGTIGFGVTESERRYDERDLAVAEEFARRAAAAIDNAQVFERERRVAQRFQEAALPTSLPRVPGLRFSSYYTPGQSEALIGGDWYDALRLPDGRVVISIGDVAGSGLDAAVTMGNVRQVIRGVAHIHADPALILDAADKTLRAEHPDRLVTAFIGVLDQVGGMLSYASAGHPAPLVRAADGTIRSLGVVGLPLGLRERDEPGAVNVELERGALLLLYTDGLVEATHDYLEGETRLRAALADLQLDGEEIARAIYERVLPGGARDDVALLAVRVADEAVAETSAVALPGFVRSWTFDARDAGAAHRARHEFAAEIVARAGSDGDATTAELVFGELVGNVVRHADGAVKVILDWSARAPVLHVIDDGPGFQHNPKLPADLLAESGRGLFLVSALTFDFQVTKRVGRGSHARTVLAVRSRRNGRQ